jgi:hypothetical protein
MTADSEVRMVTGPTTGTSLPEIVLLTIHVPRERVPSRAADCPGMGLWRHARPRLKFGRPFPRSLRELK